MQYFLITLIKNIFFKRKQTLHISSLFEEISIQVYNYIFFYKKYHKTFY